ncbi:type IV pilus biogenesis [Halobacteriovorax sp. BALOs_7]|uniref:type II secretion system protein N n=1 Tax=Halobacteriovorax sp. BALOs_7 TaxID=2109558 RepID=UPI000EA03E9B|nr:type II secretion system protein N [Halobacteriovorax sp. BALOs_7]AYF45031.1 type IV pilus biogenesis [Halobacteriovorax sp. BALOs_7]
MTKKKGFFSKIKSKLSKDQDDAEYTSENLPETPPSDEYEEYEDEEEVEADFDNEEYEEEYEELDGEDHLEVEEEDTPPTPPAVEDPTLEVYIDDLSADDEQSAGFLSKLKNKLKKNNDSHDSEDDDELEVDEIEEDEDANKYNVMQRMLDRIKSKRDELSTANVTGKKGKQQLSGPQYFLPNLLSSENRPQVHRYFILAITFVLLYQVGKMAALYLKDKGEGSSIQTTFSRPQTYEYNRPIANIRNYNPFNIQEDKNEKVEDKPKKPRNIIKVCRSAEAESKLGLKLINTVVLQNNKKSVASITNRGKRLNVRIGSKIDNIAEIGNISRQKVIFKNLRSGECEYIENVDDRARRFARKTKTKILPPSRAKDVMPEFNKDIKVEGNNFKIKKQLRDQLLSNIGDVLTQAKAITIKNPDGSLCFKMTQVKPGSIYSYLNVQNDDIICEINGAKINNMNQIMGMFGKIKSTDYYELGIKRNGVHQSFNYNFVD